MNNFLIKIKNRRFYIFTLFFVSVMLLPSFTYADWFDIQQITSDVVAWLFDLVRGIAASIFYFSAMIFDNLLAITLSTNLFNSDFIKVAWSSIRDLANVAFILGMIGIAFSMMFNYANWKKSLVALIIVAFVLNFSLYFSRVIVDAGNLSTHVFLKSISSQVDNDTEYFLAASKFYDNAQTDQFRSVGSSFVNALNPTALLGSGTFSAWQEDMGKKGQEAGLGSYLLLQFVLIVFFIIFAKHFFKAGFMFLGRMIWIVYYMVAAPAYFITAFIPGQETLWKNKWLIPLLQKSFCVVIYIFFLWLSLIILTSDIVGGLEGGQGLYEMMGIFIIKGIFVIKMLDMANKFGNKWCEEGASTLGNIMSVAGSALKYTGAGALAGSVGRTLVGGAGRRFAGSKLLHKGQSSKSATTRWASDRLALLSMSAQDLKIGKKSYSADQKTRVDTLKRVENNMDPDLVEKRRRYELGVADKETGKLDLDKVEKFAGRKEQENFKRFKDINELLERMPADDPRKQDLEDERDKHQTALEDTKMEKVLVKGKKVPGEESKITPKSVVKGAGGLLGRMLSAPVASLEARKNRTSKDQEAVKAKIKTEEKLEEKRKTFKALRAEAGDKQMEVEEKKDKVLDAVEKGDTKIAEDSLRSLIATVAKYGISDKMKNTFEKIESEITALREIERREEKLEDMKMFEDEDYRASDVNSEKEFMQKLEQMYANDQGELKDIKNALSQDRGWNAGREMNSLTRNKIKAKYDKFVTQDGYSTIDTKDMDRKKKQITRNVERVVREANNNINTEVKFNQARITEDMEVDIKKQSSVEQNIATNVNLKTVDKASDHDAGS